MAKSNPWDRQPEESDKAFEAFVIYRGLGPGRTADAVASKLGKSTTLIHRWQRLHKWVARVALFDRHLDAAATRKTESVVVARAETRTERWLRIRDETFDQAVADADKLIAQARYLASFPVFDAEVEENGRKVTYKAAKPSVLLAGSRILALGYELKRVTVERALAGLAGVSAAPPPPVDPGLTDERAAAARRQLIDWSASRQAEVRAFIDAGPPRDPADPGTGPPA